VIGQGAFGVVVAGRREDTQEVIAVKKIAVVSVTTGVD